MLYSTTLVALVLSPRLLRIMNTKRRSTICELTFSTPVLAVKLNRKRLVVVLEEVIYVYNITEMRCLHSIDTSPNPHAICALSTSSENNYLAFPISQKTPPSASAPPSQTPPTATHIPPTTGVNVVETHETPLSCIALNNHGTRLAAASEKGTIIRVFSLPDAQELYQFWRGSIRSRIYSMSFNYTSTFLCVSSATETVHIFRLQKDRRHDVTNLPSSRNPSRHNSSVNIQGRSGSPSSEDTKGDVSEFGAGTESTTSDRRALNPTFASMIRRTTQTVAKSFSATVGGYLPKAAVKLWEPRGDFAWVRIPKSHGSGRSAPRRSVVALSNSDDRVMVATNEGNYFIFDIDLEKGGEGTLIMQYL
ncbi:WD40 repeat-like protein [Zopfia rhizophila CBS 207.26]|uniref:WD40 repeat-like protein n=1 Tax=Zopfia rhizophila CBS 207.26 TaxID=1314779 RepID=A0A6A6E1U8_9PEZI|nr:WD40 repeat-like protein [Zopfia rhizophila CBS 207.26]